MPYLFYDYETDQWVNFSDRLEAITDETARRFLPLSAISVYERKLAQGYSIPVSFLVAYSFSGRIIQEN